MAVDTTQYAIIYVNHQGWKSIKSASRNHDMYNTGTVQPETKKLYPVVAFEGGGVKVRATQGCPSLTGPTEPADRITLDTADKSSWAVVSDRIDDLFRKLAEGYIIDNTGIDTTGKLYSSQITIGRPISREFVIIYVNRSGRKTIWSATMMHETYDDTIRASTEDRYPHVVFDSIGIQVRKTAACPPLSKTATDPARKTELTIPNRERNTQLFFETAIKVLYDMLNEGYVIDTALSQDQQTIVMEIPARSVGAEALRVLERLVTVFTE